VCVFLFTYLFNYYLFKQSRDSVVGTTTGYGLDDGGVGI
jgi:hypothetical protein